MRTRPANRASLSCYVRAARDFGLLMTRFALAIFLLALAGCGVLHPEHSTGAASIPAGEGGGIGPVEGSPNNASDLGPGVVPH